MLQQFQATIQQENLFISTDRILIATSGGVDSVVLCYLFRAAGLHFGIAHCNFLLRGESSDEDEQFTKDLAKQLDVPYFTTSFKTEQLAKQERLSIQEAARNLRYTWLEEIRVAEGFDYIATAHHANDALETVLYNLTKGCGIRGLHGILSKTDKLIRPLLFAAKTDIECYATAQQINFRTDASNASHKYARNKIRHQVIPVLQDLNPALINTAKRSIQQFREAEQLYDWATQQLREQIVTEEKEVLKIDRQQLEHAPTPPTLLYEWLSPLRFHIDQIQQALKAKVGARFLSASHELLVDRSFLLVRSLAEISEPESYEIHLTTDFIRTSNGKLLLKSGAELPRTFPNDPTIAYFDLERLVFPLELRHWQAGDYFCPLGMQGKRQKLQDFFNNRKLSRFEKENVWILLSNSEICWVVGHRMDERFKLTTSTQECLQLQFQPEDNNCVRDME